MSNVNLLAGSDTRRKPVADSYFPNAQSPNVGYQGQSTGKPSDPLAIEVASTSSTPMGWQTPGPSQLQQSPGPLPRNDSYLEPQTLRQTFWGTVAWDLHDIILCILPIGLIIKAGLCIHASKVDADHHGVNFDQTSAMTTNLVKFNEQLTTLFTVLFIMIIGSTVKRYALWKAQQGATLAYLEQLNSSVSMTATFKAIFSLRAFTWMSVFLIFVWSWYYAGSQAAEREYTFQESGPMHNVQLAYISNQAKSPFLDGPLSSFSTVKQTDLTSRYHIYIGRIHTGVSEVASDINGYPLVPFYDNTPANRLDPKHMRSIDAQGWLDTSQFSIQHVVNAIGTTIFTNFADPKSTTHSSQWTEGSVIGDFTYETTNFFTNCSHTTLLRQSTYPGLLPTMTLSMNVTNSTTPPTGTAYQTFNVWEQYNSTHSLQAQCNIGEIHTDVKVSCTAEGCKAIAVRPTPNKPYPNPRTVFDNSTFATSFFNSLLLATGTPDSTADLTMLEADNGWEPLKTQLLADQKAGINPQADLNYDAYAFSLSIGLTSHINTYYSAAMYMKYEHPNDIALMSADTFTINPTDVDYSFITLDGAELSLRYELSVPWIVVDMISNFVLLVAAIFSVWLRRVTLAPDVFGYVSSLTRDNPSLLSAPHGGSALSGMERARRMKGLRVKLGAAGLEDGVVEGEKGRHRIVMGQDRNEIERLRKLDRKTSYA